MKKTSLWQRFKITRDLKKHYKDHHGQIKYTRYRETATNDILKQSFECVCGEKWEIDYGWNELEEKGELGDIREVDYDWRPEKDRK